MVYDVIVVGSGPAGISASLYTKRANLETLIISKGIGTLDKVQNIENYYGLEESITGEKLQKIGEGQAENLGIEIKEEEIMQIEYDNNFIVKTLNHTYESKTVILATGSNRKTLNIKGIKEFEGKGVSYCAVCDAFFYRNKDVAIIGNGKYAINEINHLKNVVNSVVLLTEGNEPPETRGEIEVIEKQLKEYLYDYPYELNN